MLNSVHLHGCHNIGIVDMLSTHRDRFQQGKQPIRDPCIFISNLEKPCQGTGAKCDLGWAWRDRKSLWAGEYTAKLAQHLTTDPQGIAVGDQGRYCLFHLGMLRGLSNVKANDDVGIAKDLNIRRHSILHG